MNGPVLLVIDNEFITEKVLDETRILLKRINPAGQELHVLAFTEGKKEILTETNGERRKR